MPAPKRANTAAATAAVVRKAQERKAQELRDAGWVVLPPEVGEEDICGTRVCLLAELRAT